MFIFFYNRGLVIKKEKNLFYFKQIVFNYKLIKKSMYKKAIIHLMTKSRMKSEVFSSDIDAMEELSEKYGVKNVIFYK
jgi:hypothetical protein